MTEKVFIIDAQRTAIGGFLGKLKDYTAVELASKVVTELVDVNRISKVDELLVGNVISSNLGLHPAAQVGICANGVDGHVPCTMINKACASGLKAITMAAQSIKYGENEVVIAGGMESMSNAPFYVTGMRQNHRFGHTNSFDQNKGNFGIFDSLIRDGLTDPLLKKGMGELGEYCVDKYNITREELDDYSINNYKRALYGQKKGVFLKRTIPFFRRELIYDEGPSKFNEKKLKLLNPAFTDNGKLTAGNSSSLADGSAFLLLASEKYCSEQDITPIAEIKDWCDYACDPKECTSSPGPGINKLLKRIGKTHDEIDYFEVNEAYSVSGIVVHKEVGVPMSKINPYGGAVSIGHPLGASGAINVVNLLCDLEHDNLKTGIASIGNGLGGSTNLYLKRN